MILEEVARKSSPRSCSDTEVFRKMFNLEYLVNELEIVAENSDFVSGKHDTGGGGTTKIDVQQFS